MIDPAARGACRAHRRPRHVSYGCAGAGGQPHAASQAQSARAMSRGVLLALFGLLAACREHAHEDIAVPVPTATAANPVQNEMRLLTAALQTALQGIGTGDVRGLPHALHAVHAAKEATGVAIAGGKYRLPKNAERLDRFRELDEGFHRQLERLVEVSTHNDVGASAEAFAGLLPSCVQCHAEFRP